MELNTEKIIEKIDYTFHIITPILSGSSDGYRGNDNLTDQNNLEWTTTKSFVKSRFNDESILVILSQMKGPCVKKTKDDRIIINIDIKHSTLPNTSLNDIFEFIDSIYDEKILEESVKNMDIEKRKRLIILGEYLQLRQVFLIEK